MSEDANLATGGKNGLTRADLSESWFFIPIVLVNARKRVEPKRQRARVEVR